MQQDLAIPIILILDPDILKLEQFKRSSVEHFPEVFNKELLNLMLQDIIEQLLHNPKLKKQM
ncbi:MAG: hypothetical protein EBS89_09400 [Proteobacteria bacterium]|nr:hypothetical protein [Pseudomonadota bacterium]